MRRRVTLSLALLALTGTLIAQTPQPQSVTLRQPSPKVSQRDMAITIAPSQVGGGTAAVYLLRNEINVDGPGAGIGAPSPLRGTPVSGLTFGIQAWREGEKARVVVYADLADPRAPNGKTHTPIKTFAIDIGQSVEIPEAEKWGASRVFVKATPR